MTKILILDNEEKTELDLTGATSFDVIGHPGSLKWIVRAVIGSEAVTRELLIYDRFDEACHVRNSLHQHVIVEKVDVMIVDPDTGSVVPQY